jgi:predicted short-subunit dehydrogenase-like oxidoreductase (DUF2520 family)
MVGRSLGRAISARGAPVAAFASRRIEAAQQAAAEAHAPLATTESAEAARHADIVVLAVPDGAIAQVCEDVARGGGFGQGKVALHLSGALPSDILAAARAAGAAALAFHPMQTFARPDPALFAGITIAVEGDPQAVEFGFALAEFLGGTAVHIRPEDKPLYHAALCLACNYFVTLSDAAARLLQQVGFRSSPPTSAEPPATAPLLSAPSAIAALLPLLRGAVENLARVGLPDALTGPISRGDLDTLRAHLAALAARCPALLPLYRALGIETLAVALRKGTLDPASADLIRALLQEPR